MRHTTFSSPTYGAVDYPNAVAFMYSRQPVIIACDLPDNTLVTAKVTCTSKNNASYSETRKLKDQRAEFDISRIMQVLAGDPDEIMRRLDYAAPSLAELFALEIQVAGEIVMTTEDIQALHGALDAGEVYGAPATIRWFMNYPQTINMWKEPHGRFELEMAGIWYQPEFAEGGPRCREVNIAAQLPEETLDILRNASVVLGSTTWFNVIEDGLASMQPIRSIILRPDNTPRGCGLYLRWLNRRGEISYWLFDKVQQETIAAVNEAFERYYGGDPATPVDNAFRNPEKRSYVETRRQTLVTTGLTGEEFDDLCDLQVSPVVEMLGEDGTLWHRVNVDAGTQSRRNRRDTPRLHDFEISITLPKRNTVQL